MSEKKSQDLVKEKISIQVTQQPQTIKHKYSKGEIVYFSFRWPARLHLRPHLRLPLRPLLLSLENTLGILVSLKTLSEIFNGLDLKSQQEPINNPYYWYSFIGRFILYLKMRLKEWSRRFLV